MAAALQVVHAVGVLHRDLKPGNIMLRADGSVALIDFGLAKHVRVDAPRSPRTGEIFGTPYYMSPEQGHGQSLDERSDLYSLGVIFYEMLMRQKPYLAQTPMAVIYMHANAPIPLLPEELRKYQQLLNKLLAKRSRPSLASASALLAKIEELQLSDVLVAPTPQRWFEVACERWRELLVDHANCEKKAASTALSLIFAYADDLQLTDRLSRLAREELRHFEQVQKMMQELGVPFVRLKPARYAEGLRAATRRSDPGRLMDLLLCGALIEARSYERFVGLAPRLQAPLGEFYGGLAASEARHTRLYVRLAEHRAGEQDWRARLRAPGGNRSGAGDFAGSAAPLPSGLPVRSG